MSDQTKRNVLLTVAALSLQLARKYVDPYSHKFSPQRFTQEQLLTCLILRAYLKTTYRGIIEFLEVSESLKKQLGLRHLPHYSTLKKFVDRSDVLQVVDCMLLEIVHKFDPDAKDVAVDSTGFETTSASAHFQTRSGRQRNKFIKLLVCVLAGSLLPSGLAVNWGPSNDKSEAADVLAKASVAQYAFDAAGNQQRSTDPTGARTTTSWDFENQPTLYQYPDSTPATYVYNADHRRVQGNV